MKKIFFLFVAALTTVSTFSQKTSDSSKLIRGVYRTEEEAANNSPSITSGFRFSPQFGVIEPNDTVRFCDNIRLRDTTINRKKIFGFSDGKDIYVRIIEYEENGGGLISTLLNPLFYHRFYKLNYVGKYSFIRIMPARRMSITDKEGKTEKVNVSNLQKDPFSSIDDVWYFDKKGVFRKATEQAFYFILKDDKDLSKAFAAERHKTAAVYVRYLTKLNERHKFLKEISSLSPDHL